MSRLLSGWSRWEFTLLRPYIKWLIGLMVLHILMGQGWLKVDPALVLMANAILAAITANQLLVAVQERDQVLITPISRRDFLRQRYVTVLMIHIVTLFVSGILFQLSSLPRPVDPLKLWLWALIAQLFALIYCWLALPIIWRFPGKRILPIAFSLIPAGTLGKLYAQSQMATGSLFAEVSQTYLLTRLLPIALLASVISFIISYHVAQGFFRKQDI